MIKRLFWLIRAIFAYFEFKREVGNQKGVLFALRQYCYLCTECGSTGESDKLVVDGEYSVTCPDCKAEFIKIDNILQICKYWKTTIRYIVKGRYWC